MKIFSLLSGLFIVVLGVIHPARAQMKAEPVARSEAAHDQALLSAVGALADAHLSQTLQTLEVLARTAEVQSAQWERMERLVGASLPPMLPQMLWFALPDGIYYTSAAGRAGEKLNDRPYFPKLMAGEAVIGDLVISKSTGQKSTIIAVPVKQDGQVVGGIGASIFVDDLSRLLNERLRLPAGSLFYALNADGLTAFHIDPKLDFVDPRQLQSPSLETAVGTILSQVSGEVTYEFNNSPRRVYFNTSSLTGWRVAFGRILSQAPDH